MQHHAQTKEQIDLKFVIHFGTPNLLKMLVSLGLENITCHEQVLHVCISKANNDVSAD